jgi:ABC-type transport system substrate-binding protein
LQDLRKIELVDSYTVRFHFRQAAATFVGDLINAVPVILPKGWTGDFVTTPIGTGPFLLRDYRADSYAIFTRNPNYWRVPLPYLDALYVTFAPSSVAARSLAGGLSDVLLSTDSTQRPVLARSAQIRIVDPGSPFYVLTSPLAPGQRQPTPVGRFEYVYIALRSSVHGVELSPSAHAQFDSTWIARAI